jgi:hypothetical protein
MGQSHDTNTANIRSENVAKLKYGTTITITEKVKTVPATGCGSL